MGRGLDGFFCTGDRCGELCSFEGPPGALQVSGGYGEGETPLPISNRALSPSAPMVLGPQAPGRVGRRRFLSRSSRPTRAVLLRPGADVPRWAPPRGGRPRRASRRGPRWRAWRRPTARVGPRASRPPAPGAHAVPSARPSRRRAMGLHRSTRDGTTGALRPAKAPLGDAGAARARRVLDSAPAGGGGAPGQPGGPGGGGLAGGRRRGGRERRDAAARAGA